jgi:hypothetical protein
VYARALGVALAQRTYDTHESSERSALKALLTSLYLNGVLIQPDALHTTQAFFDGATASQKTASTPKGGGDVILTVKSNAAPEWQAKYLRWRSRELEVACPLEGLVRLLKQKSPSNCPIP